MGQETPPSPLVTDFCKLYVIAKRWNMNTKHAAIFILWLSIKIVDCLKMKIFATKSSINSSGFEIFFNHPQVWPPPRKSARFDMAQGWSNFLRIPTWSSEGLNLRQEKMGQISEYGCFQNQWYPQIIHFNRVFHYKPSILGYHYFWKHPYVLSILGMFFGKA